MITKNISGTKLSFAHTQKKLWLEIIKDTRNLLVGASLNASFYHAYDES